MCVEELPLLKALVSGHLTSLRSFDLTLNSLCILFLFEHREFDAVRTLVRVADLGLLRFGR
jgi:hypothetical protein